MSNPMLWRTFLPALLLMASGCLVRVPVGYAPNSGVGRPENEVEKLLVSNAGPTINRVEFRDDFFTVSAVGRYGVAQVTVRYAEAKKVSLFQVDKSHYQVAVFEAGETEVFGWTLNSLREAKQLADAISSVINKWRRGHGKGA